MPRAFRCDAGIKHVYRADLVPVGKASRNAAGFLTVPAQIAKTGTLEYTNTDGSKRIELVLADELFAAPSLDSFNSAPVVHRHPAEKVVTPSNARKLAVGWPTEVTRSDDGEHISAKLTITDADAITAIEAGERQLSPGYFCDLEPIDGGMYKMPDGTQIRADFLQRNRTHNHIAIEPIGRSGPTVAMRLDSAGDVIASLETRSTIVMEKISINGVEYEVPAAVAAEMRRLHGLVADAPKPDAVAALKTDAAEAAKLKTELGAVQGERDALKLKLDAHASAERVKAHEALVSRLAPVIEQDVAMLIKLDGAEVKRMALAKLAPETKLDGRSQEYVDGLLDALTAGRNAGSPTGRLIGDHEASLRTDAIQVDARAVSEAAFFGEFQKRVAKS